MNRFDLYTPANKQSVIPFDRVIVYENQRVPTIGVIKVVRNVGNCQSSTEPCPSCGCTNSSKYQEEEIADQNCNLIASNGYCGGEGYHAPKN